MGEEGEACWICEAPANSAEHRLKRSDVRATFGSVSQNESLFVHSETEMNVRLRTVNAPILKFDESLCEACNTRRTQPYDRAWETLSHALRTNEASILDSGGFDLKDIYGGTSHAEALYLQLFFVKLTLGQIVMSGSKIAPEPFRNALLQAVPLKDLFLKFVIYQDEDDAICFAGQSDVQEWRDPSTGEPVGLAWAYWPGSRISLQVLWTGKDDVFLGAWRPVPSACWIPVHWFLPGI